MDIDPNNAGFGFHVRCGQLNVTHVTEYSVLSLMVIRGAVGLTQ